MAAAVIKRRASGELDFGEGRGEVVAGWVDIRVDDEAGEARCGVEDGEGREVRAGTAGDRVVEVLGEVTTFEDGALDVDGLEGIDGWVGRVEELRDEGGAELDRGEASAERERLELVLGAGREELGRWTLVGGHWQVS